MRIQIFIFMLFINANLFVGIFAQEMPLVYDVENTGADCPEPPLPVYKELPKIESLPDPFMWSDTGRGRIASRAEWRCRRAEIGAEVQHYEVGTKPAPPDTLEAVFSDGVLTVTVIVGGDTLTITAPISLPEGEGPFPAVIGVGFFPTGSLPGDIFTSRGIATIHFMESQITNGWSNIRGDGPFFELYPDKKRGKFVAWAWGVSRIIDGLEKCPETNIDLSHLAVTGCSYAGKIALFSGAFDERIALTIAQEPGGGGHCAWRVTETLSGSRETLRNAQGQSWYYTGLSQFNNAVTRLPYDHHELMAMLAPRALFVLGNTDYEWMAEESGHVGCKAAQEVWKALGVPDRFGFSILGGHTHCQLPGTQRPEVEAFVEKFLLGDTTANTDIIRSPYNTDLTPWITWDTPELPEEATLIKRSKNVIDRFDLLQNYPNPFNPVTTINYHLKQEDFVQLAVYDITGKKVRTLVNQKQKAGKQTLTFDASKFASGVYVYILNVGKLTKSRKMLLLR
ncbi:T9SS type A sorting domain-containing protein [candidate division KSB1 bacterium]|nr:T9SS type A sorting domain-containing protein [candidate division KSB1 bacterium]